MSALHDLAKAVGLQIDWEDAAGEAQTVSDDNLRRVLAALGYPAGDDGEIAASLQQYRQDEGEIRFVSATMGNAFVIPADYAEQTQAKLHFENVRSQHVTLERISQGWRVPAITEIGYPTLETDRGVVKLAIAPERCLDVDDFTGGRRAWGPAVQIPSLRDARDRAFGDYGALAETAEQFGKAGADVLAISPTHALFPADASRYSPYAPSSRLFHNVHLANTIALGAELPEERSGDLIDWEQALPKRLRALRAAYDAGGDIVAGNLRTFRDRKGRELERHATFDALHAHFFEQGARSWQDWSAEYHDPDSEAVARFAAEHRDEVDFFVFAQWLADENLRTAQTAARSNGMTIGLIADLAVGMDAGGSHVWSRRDEVLPGLSIGAPPDLLGPDGQDWGLTTFAPLALKRTGFDGFIATIRTALEHAGGIRIDHALGLNRMWVIPHGGSPADGAYLKYPLTDMLRILAIESHRANAIVIGEDLGTVPEGLRPRLEQNHVLGMRVLPFERDEDGGYIPPSEWQEQAVAMTGTHDLPTIAGRWIGRDIDWTWKLGRTSPHDDEASQRAARDAERKELWDALTDSGRAEGQPPAPDDPGPVVDAALAHTARTPCELAIFPMEDIVGLIEQPNLPGTIDEHPNWRRRMPDTTESLLARSEVAARIDTINESRK